MSFGGGGQSGETRYNWNPVMEAYWGGPEGRPQEGFLERAKNASLSQYVPYTGQRVQGLTRGQGDALTGVGNIAFGGTNFGNTARNTLNDIAQGKQLGQNANPWSNSSIYQPTNEYMGNSPQFEGMLEQGRQGITDAYGKGVAADTQRAFAQGGAFGGSAHQQQIAQNQDQLANQLKQYETGQRNAQYERSAGLREGEIGRNIQSQQFDKGIGSQNYENSLARQMQAAMGGQDAEAAAIRNLTSMFGLGEQQRQLGQQQLDVNYGDWSTAQNWNRMMTDWYGNALGRAQGSTGLTTTSQGYSPQNLASTAVGAGLLGRVGGIW